MPGQMCPQMTKLTGLLSLHWNLMKSKSKQFCSLRSPHISKLFSPFSFFNFCGRKTPSMVLLVIFHPQCSVNAQGTGCLSSREKGDYLSGRTWIGTENSSPFWATQSSPLKWSFFLISCYWYYKFSASPNFIMKQPLNYRERMEMVAPHCEYIKNYWIICSL